MEWESYSPFCFSPFGYIFFFIYYGIFSHNSIFNNDILQNFFFVSYSLKQWKQTWTDLALQLKKKMIWHICWMLIQYRIWEKSSQVYSEEENIYSIHFSPLFLLVIEKRACNLKEIMWRKKKGNIYERKLRNGAIKEKFWTEIEMDWWHYLTICCPFPVLFLHFVSITLWTCVEMIRENKRCLCHNLEMRLRKGSNTERKNRDMFWCNISTMLILQLFSANLNLVVWWIVSGERSLL